MTHYEPGVTYQTPYGQFTPKAKPETTAVVTMALGIASFFFWVIPAIVALFLAPTAKRRIRESEGKLGGNGYALAGQICAVVSLVIGTLIVVAMALA